MDELYEDYTENLQDVVNEIKSWDKYKDFVYLDIPVSFYDLFKDKSYDGVEVYSICPIYDKVNNFVDVVGFCGEFSWSNNKLKSLDYDIYNEKTIVYGYREFEPELKSIGKNWLIILVGSDW